jgi:F-type H+-transporting ATPase subunit gamma
MANARLIKRRVTSVQNIAKITKAMQLVSASKTKYSQKIATSSLPYMQALLESLRNVAEVIDPSKHPFLQVKDTGSEVLVVISTNKGLCGGLNTNLFKQVNSWSKDHPQAQYIAVGQKGVNFLRNYGYDLLAGFTEYPEKVRLEDVLPLVEMLRQGYVKGEIKRVFVLFTDFINALKQQSMIFELLPIEDIQIQALANEFQHKQKQAAAQETTTKKSNNKAEYIFEPTPEALLDFLLNYYLELNFYHLVLESSASEHSARMLAMKNASDNAKELVEILKLDYNKSRQSMITNELLDMNSAKLR